MPLMTPLFERTLNQINNVIAKDLLVTSRYKNVIVAADFALDLEKALEPTVTRFSNMLDDLRDQNRELLEEREILNEQLSKQDETLKEQGETIDKLNDILRNELGWN